VTIRLPPGLDRLRSLVGLELPRADEDALWRCGRAWRAAADELRRLPPELAAVGDRIETALGGTSGTGMDGSPDPAGLAPAFARAWHPIGGADGLVDRLADACERMGLACDRAAIEVEYAKLACIATLVGLASTLAGLAMALVAGAVSALGLSAAVAAAQSTIRAVLTRLLAVVAPGIAVHHALDGLARAIRHLEGHRDGDPTGVLLDSARLASSAPLHWPGLPDGLGLAGGPFPPLVGESATGDPFSNAGDPAGNTGGSDRPQSTPVLDRAPPGASAGEPPPATPTQPGQPAPPPPPPRLPVPMPPPPPPPPPTQVPMTVPPTTVPPAAVPSPTTGPVPRGPSPGADPSTPPGPVRPGTLPSGPPAEAPSVAPPSSSGFSNERLPLSSQPPSIMVLAALSSVGRPPPVEPSPATTAPDAVRPVTDDEAVALVRRTVFDTEAGFGFYPPRDEHRVFAHAVWPADDLVTLDLLGTPDGFLIGAALLTPSQFGVGLRALVDAGRIGLPAGTGLRLVSAQAPAAALARALGVDVVAPDRPVWTTLDGVMVAASPGLVEGILLPVRPPDGAWLRFSPAGWPGRPT